MRLLRRYAPRNDMLKIFYAPRNDMLKIFYVPRMYESAA